MYMYMYIKFYMYMYIAKLVVQCSGGHLGIMCLYITCMLHIDNTLIVPS